MRTAIGLIGLGLIAGFVPTGLRGLPYALPVLAGTAGALTALVICCLASAVATRRHTPPVTLRWGSPLRPGSSRDPGHFTAGRSFGAWDVKPGRVPGGTLTGDMSHDEAILAFHAGRYDRGGHKIATDAEIQKFVQRHHGFTLKTGMDRTCQAGSRHLESTALNRLVPRLHLATSADDFTEVTSQQFSGRH
jgi:hypothetical protein